MIMLIISSNNKLCTASIHMLLGTSVRLLNGANGHQLAQCRCKTWLLDASQFPELFLTIEKIRSIFQIAQLMVVQVSSTALQESQHVGPG